MSSKTADLNRLTASDAARMIAVGAITSEALVRSCLDRIQARDPAVHAWTYIDPDDALRQARERDRAPGQHGFLHGIPVGVKDVIDTSDMPTEYNSPIYRGHRPKQDADCVSLLRAAGAVILGKNATTPFATVVPTNTRNPHNLDHTPGGSSSGPAAAVADFMVPLALGTQTGGSTLRPAAFCGVFGFKPTFTRVSIGGVKPLAISFDTLGGFSRSAEDMTLLMRALDPLASQNGVEPVPTPLRIGYCRTPFWSRAEPSTHQAMESARAALNAASVVIEDVELRANFADLATANFDLIAAESAIFLRDEYQNQREQLPPALCAQIERGLKTSPEQVHKARAAIVRHSIETDRIFNTYDALLTPTALGEAPEGLGSIGDAVFNGIWTAMHLPCITIPSATGPKGLPVGVQLVGRYDSDAKLLSIAQFVSNILLK